MVMASPLQTCWMTSSGPSALSGRYGQRLPAREPLPIELGFLRARIQVQGAVMFRVPPASTDVIEASPNGRSRMHNGRCQGRRGSPPGLRLTPGLGMESSDGRQGLRRAFLGQEGTAVQSL